jgi:hypothetical protein
MLLADCINAASLYSFDLIAIGSLQWSERGNVAGLELVRCVRRKAAQGNVVCKAEFEDLKGLMRRESIAN